MGCGGTKNEVDTVPPKPEEAKEQSEKAKKICCEEKAVEKPAEKSDENPEN